MIYTQQHIMPKTIKKPIKIKKTVQDIKTMTDTMKKNLNKAQKAWSKAQAAFNKADDALGLAQKMTQNQNQKVYGKIVRLGAQMTDAEAKEMVKMTEINDFIINYSNELFNDYGIEQSAEALMNDIKTQRASMKEPCAVCDI